LFLVSSIAVYGSNALPFTEEQTPKPEDPYGIAKYAVEMDLQNAAHLFDLDFTVFRPHNVYGQNKILEINTEMLLESL
jgi:Nucleoside-diphosphate-sugar epimerases